MPHQRRGSGARLPAEHRPADHLPSAGAEPRRRRADGARNAGSSRRHRRLRRRRDPDPLRLDDLQADRLRRRPRGGDRGDARRAQRLRHPWRRRATSRSSRRCSATRASPRATSPRRSSPRSIRRGSARPRSRTGDRDFLLAARGRVRAPPAGALVGPDRAAARPRAAPRRAVRRRRGRRHRRAPRDAGRRARRRQRLSRDPRRPDAPDLVRESAAPRSRSTAASTARRSGPRSSARAWRCASPTTARGSRSG